MLPPPLQAREEEEEEDGGTVDSAVGSGSVAESTSLNIEPRSEASDATVSNLLRAAPLCSVKLPLSSPPPASALSGLSVKDHSCYGFFLSICLSVCMHAEHESVARGIDGEGSGLT